MPNELPAPLVAVVVPVFNRLGLLRETVASLQAQTLSPVEFILVDDQSDAETREFLQDLAGRDFRFRILWKPDGIPKGCQSSRNLGLAECRAQAVVFLDSDDLLTPQCLELRHRELSNRPEVDILVGRQAIFWDATGEIKWVNIPRSGVAEIERYLDLCDPLDVPWVNGGVMIRTHRLKEKAVEWSRDYHWDDLAFHFSSLVRGLRVWWMEYEMEFPDAYYRQHSGEHYGRTLKTAEGVRNMAEMMLWMKKELQDAGEWTESRRTRLARSYFHLCVLKPIDLHLLPLARQLMIQGGQAGFFDWFELRCLRLYSIGRGVFSAWPRVTHMWNRMARRSYLRDWFTGAPWTYGKVPPAAGPGGATGFFRPQR